MKINKISLSLLLVLGVLVMTSLVSALDPEITLNTPASNTYMRDNTVFNVTINSSASNAGDNLVNVTFFAKSDLTANSTWTVIGANNSLNMTVLVNETRTTINVSSLEDADNYVINVTVWNKTNGVWIGEDTITGIKIDTTVPSTPTSLLPTSDGDGDVTFSATVTGRETTNCTITFVGTYPPGGSSAQEMTHSGDTCSLSMTSLPEGIYTYLVAASDGSNTTNSGTEQINIDIKTSAGKAALLASQPGVTPKGGAVLAVADIPVIGGTLDKLGGMTTIIVVIVVITLIVIIKRR